jgi:signal transduction histidine kinase
MICYLFPEPTYLFFSSDVPALLYYAHIPAMIIALLVGLFVYLKGRKLLLNRLLFAISIFFSIWTIINLITWTNIHSDFILFAWSFFGLIFGLISIFSIYFVYVFLEKKDVSVHLKIIFLALLSPVLLLAPTNFNLSGFDLTNCDAFKFEGLTFQSYYTSLGVLAMIWIFVLLVRRYHKAAPEFKKQIALIGVGIELFLFFFFLVVFLASYLTGIGFLPDSEIELYGLFGVVIFMVYISILMVRFSIFNIKLIATQALVWGLVILIGAQFFFIKVPINFVLTGVTFVASVVFGYLLIKSVKKEVEQKEELAKLNIDLNDLIVQRESLVHLVTHKVKGSFTRSKYIFAGILDGTFGDVNEEVKRRAEQGLESDNGGIETVDLVLNAANLQKGTVKYEMKDINFKELVEKTISEKKVSIEAKGLKLEEDTKDDAYNLSGDAFWLKEVINNLLENSIKYTKEGKITVGLEKKDKKILFYVKDTGIGVTDEDKKNLFTEGGRGKDSVRVNVDSTGYGLYSVRLIVEAHKGKVWMEPNKEGVGSVFYVELDAA